MNKFLYITLSTMLFVACAGGDAAKQSGNLAVRTYVAHSLDSDSDRKFSFISKPYNQTALSFRVGGPVVKFDAQSGQFYKRGALIASIDDRDFTIRRDRAEAVFNQSDLEFKRVAALYATNNISGSSYEKARADLAIAKANYQTAENELKDTQLRAPFDGYVQTLHIEPFQDVKPSQSVVTFIDLSRVKVEAFIPENLAMQMRRQSAKNDKVKITFDAMSDKQFGASQIDISKSATTNNLSFLLTAIVPNPSGELLGGMNGTIAVDPSFGATAAAVVGGNATDRTANVGGAVATSDIVVVPQYAVCHNDSRGDFVWIADKETGAVKAVDVVLGKIRNNSVELLGGVCEGDVVVLTKQEFLVDNMVVTIQ